MHWTNVGKPKPKYANRSGAVVTYMVGEPKPELPAPPKRGGKQTIKPKSGAGVPVTLGRPQRGVTKTTKEQQKADARVAAHTEQREAHRRRKAKAQERKAVQREQRRDRHWQEEGLSESVPVWRSHTPKPKRRRRRAD